MTNLGPNGLLSQVTPLTKGILWFTSGAVSVEKPFYKDVDYLLNGLLTATLKTSEASGSHVLISENFGSSFYVIVADAVSEKELSSYFELLKPQLSGEGHLLMIDETSSFAQIQKIAPTDLKSKIQVIQ